MILALMGVSGSGKTTVGKALAESLRWPFLEADEFHPRANVAKMAAGHALDDADRWPWLERVADELRRFLARGESAVLACSALKESYRARLRAAGDVRFVHLVGDYDTLLERARARDHAFMPPELLASQFAALEPPEDALEVDVHRPIEAQLAAIRAAFGLAPAGPARDAERGAT